MVLILIDINDISMVGLNLRVCFLLFFLCLCLWSV